MFNRKDKNNSLETKIIGIAGAGEKSGCTHAGIILANRIKASGCRVAILEENKSKCFQKIAEEFECEINNEGKFVYQSIDYYIYRKPRLLPIILKEGYDFLIVDHGNFNDCDKDFYLTNHMHIIVCGSRPWEMDSIQDIFETIQTEEMLEAFHYCFNFAHDNIHLQRNIKKAMGTLQNVYFPPYSEDVFHNSDFGDLDKAVGITIADNVPKTEGVRLIGVFGKKKEEKKPTAVCEPVLIEEKEKTSKKKEKTQKNVVQEQHYEEGLKDIPETSFTEIENMEDSSFETTPVADENETFVESSVTVSFTEKAVDPEPKLEPEITPEPKQEFNAAPSFEAETESKSKSDSKPEWEPKPEVRLNPNLKLEPKPELEAKTEVRNEEEIENIANQDTTDECIQAEELIPEMQEMQKDNNPKEVSSDNEGYSEPIVCYESDEQAMKLFNEIRDVQKFVSYKLKNLIDDKDAKVIENFFNKSIQLAFVSVLRGGVMHTRENGKDGAAAISIKNDSMNYELRESALKELLGKEDYLIDPYEDNYVDF